MSMAVKNRETVVYQDEGNANDSEHIMTLEEVRPLSFWKEYAHKLGYDWLYKGYRRHGWPEKRVDQVVVFSKKPWPAIEIERRRANGFLRITEYYTGRTEKNKSSFRWTSDMKVWSKSNY